MFPQTSNPTTATIVSEALFYTGCDTPLQGPVWGGLSLVPLITVIQVCLLTFVDF